MTFAHIRIGSLHFTAQMEETDAPRTCDMLRQFIPLQAKTIQAVWCGEAIWIQLNGHSTPLPRENETSIPNLGEILFYSDQSGRSGLLFPYGSASFKDKHGSLSGNHCLTIISGNHAFQELGKRVLWDGAQTVHIDLASKT